MEETTGRAKGGKARAEKLSPEERSEIAKKAGAARWKEPKAGVAKAIYAGDLVLGDIALPCSVIQEADGKIVRVISARGINAAFTGKTASGGRSDGGQKIPRFLGIKGVKQLINDDLLAAILTPIEYHPLHGGRSAYGYEATLLPEICEVILDAGHAGAVKDRAQLLVAETLLRGLARVGIVALVDEATGYQEERARDALAKFLELYFVEEKTRLKWAKTFPDEFYKEMYRLRGWTWPTGVGGKTSYVGKLTNEVVYKRLPNGVLEELKERNPVIPERKRRAYTHTQFLSEDIGQQDLRKHLDQTTVLMKASRSWQEFIRLLDRVSPKGKEIPLSLLDI